MRVSHLPMGPGALSEYYDWFKDAMPGDVLVYWRGDLSSDREFDGSKSVIDHDERLTRMAIHSAAKAIRRDAANGSLILTQVRHGVGDYTYRAQRKATQLEAATRLLCGA